MSAALDRLAAEVEDDHGATVEVVCVGDASVDERLEALLQAAREAMVNAAKYAASDGPVSVYAEAAGDDIEVFVRDRGPGFDPAAVPAGRHGLRDSVVLLQRSYRFGAESGIGRVSRAVREGAPEALELLRSGTLPDVAWVGLGEPGGDARSLGARIVEGSREFLASKTPEEAFEAFGRFRVLCALRRGPFGVEAVNQLAERALAAAGLIRPPRAGAPWYRGRPVMVTVNDYGLGLFNGDVGIALPDPDAAGDLRVFFPGARGGLRSLPPARVPAHETVFAMTVHKSQGSELDAVALLLGDRAVPLLTRELVYTGFTRARSRVEVWGTPEVFRAAVDRRLGRRSGLRDALWGAGSPGLEI
ncbi:MAG: ATP-binding domain-containing protein [Deltaproteobacteria bacterium]|nr:ATP-binding domain-containing protein [Deltaproteobacteria bacterium]